MRGRVSDNEREHSFAKWRDTEIRTWAAGDTIVHARFSMGLIVGPRGLMIAQGVQDEQHEHGFTATEERAIYEALRMRYDAKHKAAVEQSALAKLTPLEQEALRQRWAVKP